MLMARKTWFIAAALAAVSWHGAVACQGKRMVYRDEFKTFDSAWGEDDNASVSGGRLLLQEPAGQGSFADHLLNQSNVYHDIDECITVEFTRTTDPNGASAGLAFWGTDDSHYYMLVVSPTGQYIVLRKVAAFRNLVPIGWTRSAALRQGLNAPNELEVVTHGNRATLIINGVQVDQLEGDPPASGSLTGVYWAVQSDRTTLVEFSNFRIMK